MIAVGIFSPKLTRLTRTSWQIPRTLLRLEISTTGGVQATSKPQAMGGAA